MPADCRNGRRRSLILIGFTLLFFQGISELIKRIAVMRGLIPDPYQAAAARMRRPRPRSSACSPKPSSPKNSQAPLNRRSVLE